MSDVLTPEEVAAELRLGVSTVYRALNEKRLPGNKILGRWRTRREDLEALHAPSSDPMPKPKRDSVLAEVVELREKV